MSSHRQSRTDTQRVKGTRRSCRDVTEALGPRPSEGPVWLERDNHVTSRDVKRRRRRLIVATVVMASLGFIGSLEFVVTAW